MIKTFISAYKLRNTYHVNSFIYSLRQIPILNKIVTDKAYKYKKIKLLGTFISIVKELFTTFVGKLLFVLMLIYLIDGFYKTSANDTFLHLFVFLTISGAFMNTYIFNPTKDKYYAIFLMKLDAKDYTITNLLFYLMKLVIGYIPFTLLFATTLGISSIMCILLAVFAALPKLVVIAYYINCYKKTNVAINENNLNKKIYIIIGVCLLIALGLPFINIVINDLIFILIFILFLVLGIVAMKSIYVFNDYRMLFKSILTRNNMNVLEDIKLGEELKKQASSFIELDNEQHSSKSGVEFLNDLFIKRHSKILTKSIKKQVLFVCISVVFATIFLMINVEFKKVIIDNINIIIPAMVFLMFMLNRSDTATQVMFINCDHSLLTYNVYRRPNNLLKLFFVRLKSLTIINSYTSIILAVAVSIILYICNANLLIVEYLIICIAIIALNVLFSAHSLVLYYLFQPYNINTEVKSFTFNIAKSITGFLTWFILGIKMDIVLLSIYICIFSVIYLIVSTIIIYKYATKTFKIRF